MKFTLKIKITGSKACFRLYWDKRANSLGLVGCMQALSASTLFRALECQVRSTLLPGWEESSSMTVCQNHWQELASSSMILTLTWGHPPIQQTGSLREMHDGPPTAVGFMRFEAPSLHIKTVFNDLSETWVRIRWSLNVSFVSQSCLNLGKISVPGGPNKMHLYGTMLGNPSELMSFVQPSFQWISSTQKSNLIIA